MKKKTGTVYAIVLAGGGGTRLWPVSRKNTPKQILPFIGKKTLLQTTIQRIGKIVPPSRTYLVTNIKHKKDVEKQLPRFSKKQILYEPEKRDTAAAIGFAAAVIHAQDPDAVVTTVNSDGFIQNGKEYVKLVKLAGRTAHAHPQYSVLIGVNPSYPETGYGYIKLAKRMVEKNNEQIFHVDCFVEKPDLEHAKKYVKRWDYLWNPAFFFWHIETLLGLYRKHLPKHYALIQQIERAYGSPGFASALKNIFPKFNPVSIDYGIMEKTKQMLVIPGNFGWADIGHWRSVKDVLSNEHAQNVIKGKHIGIDTDGSLIYGYSNRLIATIGVKDLVIIDTPDVLLVCPKESSQKVKKIVDTLKEKGLSRYV